MSILLTWNAEDNIGNFRVNTTVYQIYQKPVLSFTYDSLFYEPVTNNTRYIEGGVSTELTSVQIDEISSHVLTYETALVHCIDANGMYVGQYPDFSQYDTVAAAPPTSENWVYQNGEWVFVHGVDDQGHYMANVPFNFATDVATSAPSGFLTLWNNVSGEWEDERTLAQFQTHSVFDLQMTKDTLLSQGAVFNTNTFDCLNGSIMLLAALVQAGNDISWRDVSNVMVSLTNAEGVLLLAALTDAHQQVAQEYFQNKDLIMAENDRTVISTILTTYESFVVV